MAYTHTQQQTQALSWSQTQKAYQSGIMGSLKVNLKLLLLEQPQRKGKWCRLRDTAEDASKICVCNRDTYSAGVLLWGRPCRVRQSSEPAQGSYKGPPQLCQQTGNCCAFSQLHMAPSASLVLSYFNSITLLPTRDSAFQQSSPNTLHILFPADRFPGDRRILLRLPSCCSQAGPLC